MSTSQPLMQGSPSKITDYYPSSPKQTNDKKSNVKSKLCDSQLSRAMASIQLSPEGSPIKNGPCEQLAMHKQKPATPPSESDCISINDNLKQTVAENGEGPENIAPVCDNLAMKEELNAVSLEPPKKPAVALNGKASGKKGRARRRKVKNENTPIKEEKPKPSAAKVKKAPENNTLLTDFYPIRRSARVPRNELKKMEQSKIEEAIMSNQIDGLSVETFPLKGRGIVATKAFKKGEFVVEYAGDLIDLDTAKQRDKEYTGKTDVGCYMYYFKHKNRDYCIDATAETGKLGRLLNHSKSSPNCCTRVVSVYDRPYLIIVAVRNIEIGEELLYDYGDRNKETLAANPWLAY